ncbi:hypothetical protein GDY84_07620 [Bombella apis]|nr:hypothetical protein [Bombella apis]
MNNRTKFLRDVDEFLATHSLAPTKFGLLVMNDGKFISDVKRGRRIWAETEEKVRIFMREYPTNQRSA